MPNTLYFDCSYGASGDMILGALVGAGCPFAPLKRALEDGLGVQGIGLSRGRVTRSGVSAVRVRVRIDKQHDRHRHLRHVIEIIDNADLPERAAERAREAYRLIAQAEAKVHNSTPEKIHFHEVGALDAIADVAGAMIALEMLEAQHIAVSPIALGSGTARCAHGEIPVPAPATLEILRGVPTFGCGHRMEMTTPTGAAILRAVADSFGPQPLMTHQATGYGAGKRTIEGHANFLRVVKGQAPCAGPEAPGIDSMPLSLLVTEIDDMNPELLGALMESLFKAGCLDAHFTPVQMKKNRPATQVQVLCSAEAAAGLVEHLLRHTTTFGVKVLDIGRVCLARRQDTIETEIGPVDVKEGLWAGETLKVSPEYESCRRLARTRKIPVGRVYEIARAAIEARYFQGKTPARKIR